MMRRDQSRSGPVRAGVGSFPRGVRLPRRPRQVYLCTVGQTWVSWAFCVSTRYTCSEWQEGNVDRHSTRGGSISTIGKSVGYRIRRFDENDTKVTPPSLVCSISRMQIQWAVVKLACVAKSECCCTSMGSRFMYQCRAWFIMATCENGARSTACFLVWPLRFRTTLRLHHRNDTFRTAPANTSILRPPRSRTASLSPRYGAWYLAKWTIRLPRLRMCHALALAFYHLIAPL